MHERLHEEEPKKEAKKETKRKKLIDNRSKHRHYGSREKYEAPKRNSSPFLGGRVASAPHICSLGRNQVGGHTGCMLRSTIQKSLRRDSKRPKIT